MSENSVQTEAVGFIGTGQMGLPMALNLLAAGHQLVVFDVMREPLIRLADEGAVIANSPRDVADRVETVLVSLPTPDVVAAVALGDDGIHAGARVRNYIDLSTTGAVIARRVASGLAERGIRTLDSPVSGGQRGAEAGTLTLMVAGDAELFTTARPWLEGIGNEFFHVGDEVGLAQTCKLCNNFLSAANSVAAAEAMVTAVKGGLDPQVALDVINASSGRNSATADKFEALVLSRRFDKSMKTRLLLKDLSLFAAEAEALGVPTWVAANVKQLLTYAVTQGYGDKASVTMIQHWEKWAGVEVDGRRS
ncbi:MAG: NAD(P)-dependent oxidoreductase [Pseudomonadota bacterium]